MDLSRFEKIPSNNVFHTLRAGYHIFDRDNMEYKVNDMGLLVEREATTEDFYLSGLPFNDLLTKDLYTYRPFDVRSAMTESPDKWVGKFKSGSEWWAVGFDTKHFNVIAKPLKLNIPVDTERSGMTFPRAEDLDACIPIGVDTE